jgi:acid phosphatase type 7
MSPSLIDSPPVLQNPTPDGVTVVSAVTAPATGWVEYGPTPELGRRAHSAACGLIAVCDRFLSVRLTGLTPGEPVYYRVIAVPVVYRGTYEIERGDAVVGPVFRYVPPSAPTDTATFAVLNDTHENEPTLRALTAALTSDAPDVTVLNGDVCNNVLSDDSILRAALRPPGGVAIGAERAVLFVPGNHDHRGAAARGLCRAFTPWPSEDPAVARCFAIASAPSRSSGSTRARTSPTTTRRGRDWRRSSRTARGSATGSNAHFGDQRSRPRRTWSCSPTSPFAASRATTPATRSKATPDTPATASSSGTPCWPRPGRRS